MFKITLFGASHTQQLGIVVDGCPPGILIDLTKMYDFICRRKSGSTGTTPRIETDLPSVISGIIDNYTDGSPVCIIFSNSNAHSSDYTFVKETPRPGHADLTATKKYFGYNDFRGGGMFSGRMTLPIVVAGFIAKQIILHIDIQAQILSVGGEKNYGQIISEATKSGNSLGAIIECRCNQVPDSFGEPFFNSVESEISHLVFSIPGIIGIEFGAGFAGTAMSGGRFNDTIQDQYGRTSSNNSGGINGGITNGNEIVFRVAVKPTPSISLEQSSFNFLTRKIENFKITGRHDTCFALRLPPVIESATAIVLADFHLKRLAEISQQSIINNGK